MKYIRERKTNMILYYLSVESKKYNKLLNIIKKKEADGQQTHKMMLNITNY